MKSLFIINTTKMLRIVEHIIDLHSIQQSNIVLLIDRSLIKDHEFSRMKYECYDLDAWQKHRACANESVEINQYQLFVTVPTRNNVLSLITREECLRYFLIDEGIYSYSLITHRYTYYLLRFAPLYGYLVSLIKRNFSTFYILRTKYSGCYSLCTDAFGHARNKTQLDYQKIFDVSEDKPSKNIIVLPLFINVKVEKHLTNIISLIRKIDKRTKQVTYVSIHPGQRQHTQEHNALKKVLCDENVNILDDHFVVEDLLFGGEHKFYCFDETSLYILARENSTAMIYFVDKRLSNFSDTSKRLLSTKKYENIKFKRLSEL